MNQVFDTNILIDYLNGIPQAAELVDRVQPSAISRVPWMEVLGGAVGTQDETVVRRFLDRFRVVEVDGAVAESAVCLRSTHRLRLPDAIILATARVLGCQIVTRNTRDFDPTWPDVVAPYAL